MSHSLSDLLLRCAQQFEDQHAPQNMTIALREAARELDRLYAGGCARDQSTTQYCSEAARLAVENEQNAVDLEEYRRDVTRLTAEVVRLQSELADALTDLNTARQDNASFGPEFKRLTAEVERLKTSGIAEVAAHNPSVMDWIKHWEDRTLKADAEVERLRAALLKVTDALNQGRIVPRCHGVSGMTIEAQMRASVYNGVPVWPIEDAREILDEVNARAALNPPAPHTGAPDMTDTWQPIETAPLDGTRVIVWAEGKSFHARWRKDYFNDFSWCTDAGAALDGPDYWMPPPRPPQETKP